MSYSTGVTKGYGFCMNDLSEVTVMGENLRELIANSPRLSKLSEEGKLHYKVDDDGFVDLYADYGDDDEAYVDSLDCEGDFLTYILLTALNDLSQKKYGKDYFISVDDYDTIEYILLCPVLPWSIAEGTDYPKSKPEIDEMYLQVFRSLFGEDIPTVKFEDITVVNDD